jgi:hypothetical protein
VQSAVTLYGTLLSEFDGFNVDPNISLLNDNLKSPEIYFVAGYTRIFAVSKSVAQTLHPNTICSLLLFLYYMFRPFIRPSSCRK